MAEILLRPWRGSSHETDLLKETKKPTTTSIVRCAGRDEQKRTGNEGTSPARKEAQSEPKRKNNELNEAQCGASSASDFFFSEPCYTYYSFAEFGRYRHASSRQASRTRGTSAHESCSCSHNNRVRDGTWISIKDKSFRRRSAARREACMHSPSKEDPKTLEHRVAKRALFELTVQDLE